MGKTEAFVKLEQFEHKRLVEDIIGFSLFHLLPNLKDIIFHAMKDEVGKQDEIMVPKMV